MNIRSLYLIAAMVGLIAAPAARHASAEAWIRAESPHFVAYSDTGETETRAYLLRLERYRYVLNAFYGQPTVDDGQMPKFLMYFLADRNDMRAVWPGAPADLAGFYKACPDGEAAFALNLKDGLAAKEKDVTSLPENTSQIVIFYEYASAFMLQNSEQTYPAWFASGFAEYYSTARMTDEKVAVGLIRSDNTMTLGRESHIQFADILRGRPTDPKKADDFRAGAWLLTHWFMATPDRQAQLTAYINAYNRGEDPVTAFEKATGITMDKLGSVLDHYLEHDIKAEIVKVRDMPTPEITTTAMPLSAKKLLLWDGAARACMYGDKDHMPSVRAEAALYPNDDYAQMALARIEVIVGDEALAVPYLVRKVTAQPNDSDAATLLGDAYLFMSWHNKLAAGETKASQMQKARDLLMHAYKLDPLNAPALFNLSLAQADLPGYPNAIAMNAAMQAHNIMPNVSDYSLELARLLVIADRRGEARPLLVGLANGPGGDKKAAWAAAILAGLDRNASKEEMASLFKPPPPPISPGNPPKN